jgi:hypothetical protein
VEWERRKYTYGEQVKALAAEINRLATDAPGV